MNRILKTTLLALAANSLLTAFNGGSTASAQRRTDKLDRGIVAVPSTTSGYLVSWRLMGEEYYNTTFNLYRNGTKLNSTPLSVSNYVDTGGSSTSQYQVAAVVDGVEQEKSDAVTPWTSVDGNGNPYYQFSMQSVIDRDGVDATDEYTLNDVSLGDVTGNGITEFLVKRNSNYAYDLTTTARNHLLECYDINGNRLWYIDLGPNMLSGADEQRDAVMYDWDGDGKAEVILRGADNMRIITAEGDTIYIGDTTTDTRWDGIEFTSTGNEYLLYLEGATGVPYQIGPDEHPNYMEYPLARGNDSDWGTGIVGHRSTKHYFGAPFLDGRNASIFLGRGCYTKHHFAAYDVDASTHQLTQRWEWKSDNLSSSWYGQGYHNYSIGDVDMDGRDEILFGSMVIDDNGKGLSTSGLGHGDAQHWSDFDPYRWGLEFFGCNEDSPNMNYRNATTSELYYRSVGTSDDGRALMANFSDSYPGSLGRSVNTGMISSVADKEISALDNIAYSDLNFRIYWDGDLLDEILNSPGTAREAKIEKYGTGRILTSSGCHMNNSSKNNPGASGDILGDWREEFVITVSTEQALRIYATPYSTTYRIPTLWHDHQYRQAMVWQTIGYNQPPHKSYFLGELEGITQAPPPLTNTNRTEIANGGSISTSNNGTQVMVAETNNTSISVESGASPSVAFFNVPSWTQGDNDNDMITTTYYTCTVSGQPFTGGMRLTKQGEGTLVLPAVAQAYTGPTDVWNGTLQFDGTLLNSSLWLNRHTTLSSDGGQFRSITADYNSSILPGGTDNIGSITTDTLNLGFGSRIIIDVNGTSVDQIKASVLTIETKDWTYGPEYLQPVIEFNVTGDISEGTYPLGTVSSVSSGAISSIKIEGIPSSMKASLSLSDDGQLSLVIEGLRDAASVTWTGSEGSAWDLASTENFVLESGDASVFVTGDNVTFDDSSSQLTVSLSDELEPASVLVNSSSNYTFSGTGKIAGDATLTKQGSGKLTLSTDNTFSGAVRLSEGTVSVATLSNSVQSYGGLGAVKEKAADFIIENGAILQTTSGLTNASPIQADDGVINAGADFTQNAAISGSKLTKKGTGWLKMNVGNTSLDTLSIEAGAIEMTTDNNLWPAKVVSIAGGSLYDFDGSGSYSNYTYPVDVPAGKSGSWYLDTRGTYANKLTGSGTLTVVVRTNIQRTNITGNWSNFTGVIKTSATNSGVFPLDNSYGLANAELNIGSGLYVANTSGKTFAIGKLSGSGSLMGPVLYSSGTVSGTVTWKIGNDNNWTFSGGITGACNITKAGSGRAYLTGTCDYTGTTTVSEGTLAFGNSTALGTGSITVAKGATLAGTTASGSTLTNSAYTINGTLQVGVTSVSTSGGITFNEKNVTFGSNSTLIIGVRRGASETLTGGACLSGINRISMNGTVDVRVSSSNTLAEGDSVILWKATTYAGSPKLESYIVDSDAGLYWDDTDLASQGILRVTTTVPTAIAGVSSTETAPISVYSTNGSLIMQLNATVQEAERRVRQSTLPHGVYILRIQTASGDVDRKISK